jgi:hypothetical protein
MSGQSPSTACNANLSMLKQLKDPRNADTDNRSSHNAQSHHLSQFLNNPPRWKRSCRQTAALRQLQCRNWLRVGFDNLIGATTVALIWIGSYIARWFEKLLTTQQVRSLSIYATALLIAIVTLAFCREINMYCMRAVVQHENAFMQHTNTPSMISTTRQNLFLTRLRSLI